MKRKLRQDAEGDHAVTTLTRLRRATPVDCSALVDVEDQLQAINDTADAALSVAQLVNSSAGILVDQVKSSLDNTATLLDGVKAAAAVAAAFNGGASTTAAVEAFIDQLAPLLAAVLTNLQDLVDAADEKLASAMEKITDARDASLDQFAAAVTQVASLCDLDPTASLLLMKKKAYTKKGYPSWFRNLRLGGHERGSGDDFDKAEASIAAANATAVEMSDMLDELNATAVGQLTAIFDAATSGLTALKEEALPKALEKADGKIPAPVMAIVESKANSAFDKALEVLDDLAATVANATEVISEQVEESKAQLAPAFEASEGLDAIVETVRGEAEEAAAMTATSRRRRRRASSSSP